MTIKEEIIDTLTVIGIDYENGKMAGEIDSLQFVHALLEIENKFDIIIPESLLRADLLYDIDSLSESILSLMK